ncbi:GNAT family N-acetyltransferase [Sphingomonas lutea]|uniref:GNAT family N-acetyltransferase n=1 Tax=Sphingomonas lutea TaxID=1045317 RepID=A0A7G9SI70_9SPHN|nr:GNAT family N-acetyltransferase [Sphingomonas lutea]QNN67545.1 GNAT family N-acetyltransferase [Sphingomonas lutea]
MIVRRATVADFPAWAEMLAALHGDIADFAAELPVFTALDQPYVGFIAFDGDAAIGMIDARERNFAEGAPNLRAAYVEDLWVAPSHRGRGIARLLLDAVEQWARDQGLEWLGSDALIDNEASHAWHRAAGFTEIERLVVFGKPLD